MYFNKILIDQSNSNSVIVKVAPKVYMLLTMIAVLVTVDSLTW